VNRLEGLIWAIRTYPLKITLKIVHEKLFYHRIVGYRVIRSLFEGKYGLEIGGPSKIFSNRGLIPIYDVVSGLDICDYSNLTIWNANIVNQHSYKYLKNKLMTQYISEATDIGFASEGKYDFVISSNCLEHIANPLKAIQEWTRVIKKAGLILIVVPNKDYCFDHKRDETKLSHLIDDFEKDIGEDDLTHLNEILGLHDLKMERDAQDLANFIKRSKDNIRYRALHHHVFSLDVLKEMVDYFNLKVILAHKCKDIVVLAKKS
jgi:SAM-dependent methyltransferase